MFLSINVAATISAKESTTTELTPRANKSLSNEEKTTLEKTITSGNIFYCFDSLE